MLRKIEELRKQPVHIRNRYAFWIAFLCTLVIAFIWSIAVPLKLIQEETSVAENDAKEETQSSFFNTLGEITSSIKSSLGNLKPEVEYTQENTHKEEVKDEDTLDLNALYASSTLMQKQRKATQTASTTLATSTPLN